MTQILPSTDPLLNSGVNWTRSGDTYTTTGQFASIIFEFSPLTSGKLYFEIQMTSETSSFGWYFGIQRTPQRTGNFHNGTSANGNLAESVNFLPTLNTRHRVIVDLTAGTMQIDNNAVQTLAGTGPIYFGIYDGTSGGTGAGILYYTASSFLNSIPAGTTAWADATNATAPGLSIIPLSPVGVGNTFVVRLVANVADNTQIPYTITDVSSTDIDGAALTGNFVVVNSSAEITFKSTAANTPKTFSISSNNFTQAVSLIENIYGLSLISEDPNILFSSVNFPLSVDLSSSANLTNISILNPQDLFKFYSQASDVVTFFTSLNGPSLIDLSIYNTGLLNITVLQANNLYKHVLQLGDPVMEVGKAFLSTDFVSITDFNVPDPVPLTFPERWAG